jgi:hypothetical protein
MILLDENVHQQSLVASIATWYRGQVRSLTTLRPNTLIKDEAIPIVLRQVRQLTFVTTTTNVAGFWRRVPAHSRYSIVCIALPNERLHELPSLLRQLLRLPEFNTKAKRIGKVIRVSPSQLQYYEWQGDHIAHVRTWPV